MDKRRRHLLAALAASPLLLSRPLRASSPRGRVVVVGGGWGGLAAAAELRRRAPELDVTLIEPQASFFSLPLSNKWLAGQLDIRQLQRAYGSAASRHGYRWERAAVTAIDRERREVRTAVTRFGYDWLVLATGIRHDYSAWFGEDKDAATLCANRYGAAFLSGPELLDLKQRIDAFSGGDLVMNIPSGQFRCPPAPYERASAIAHLFKQRRIKGRVILLDGGPGILGFRQLFAERYKDQIVHMAHAEIKSVDPRARMVRTEFDEYRFDDAILMPPQQAHGLVWEAGLIARDAGGVSTGWAALDPVHLHAEGDPRVFLVGDLIGQVSPLFPGYSKTGHVAAALGRIAAAQIAARAAGVDPEVMLPDSVCHVISDFGLPEGIRVDASYRQRGDGLITQTTRQKREPQPRKEDEAWLAGMLDTFFE